MLKLSTIAALDVGTLHLLDAADEKMFTDDGKPVTVTIYGPGSKAYQAANSARQNRLISRLQKKGSVVDESAESKAKADATFLAAITAGDENLDIEGLTEGLTGKAKYLAIFNHAPIGYLGDQVAKYAADWANFSTGSAKS